MPERAERRLKLVSNFLDEILGYLAKGGFVMFPLAVATAVLWYSLGYRFYTLKRGTAHTVRGLLRIAEKKDSLSSRGILDSAVSIAVEVKKKCTTDLRDELDDALFPLVREISKYRKLVTTIVMVAPLLGLLGTVTGMIETFDSLGDMSLYSQSGGIAGGISQALFTTQMGLAVAVPGLVVGRILERKEMNLVREIAQVKDFLCISKNEKGERDEI